MCNVKDKLMVNNHETIIHKTSHKKGHRHDDYAAYKNNPPVTPKEVASVFDLEH